MDGDPYWAEIVEQFGHLSLDSRERLAKAARDMRACEERGREFELQLVVLGCTQLGCACEHRHTRRL